VTEYDSPVERAEVLDEIRVAEEQIARGEALDHDEAKQYVLARLHAEDVNLNV
jgi:hypothetical protein